MTLWNLYSISDENIPVIIKDYENKDVLYKGGFWGVPVCYENLEIGFIRKDDESGALVIFLISGAKLSELQKGITNEEI